MTVTVILGTQWGDEGKGKITDCLAESSDFIVRFQGGNNAGHTIVVGSEVFKFHLLPSGIIRDDKIVMIGNGVIIDPEVLVAELEQLHSRGVRTAELNISPRANIIMPYHKLQDNLEEAAKGKNKIGTTGRGIGPCYADKIARNGVRFFELIDPALFEQRLKQVALLKSQYLKSLDDTYELDIEAIKSEYLPFGEQLKGFYADVEYELQTAVKDGRHVLLEGAQGTMLDIDHGTYPFVTSSNTVAGNASVGSGIGPKHIDRIVGVVKAYTTRVGAGPFVTELKDETGDYLRDKGGEYGTTTGRPRRCGWLDLVVVNQSIRLNSLTSLAVTKLDVLSGLEELKICTSYDHHGKVLISLPTSLEDIRECEPVYEILPGFKNHSKEEWQAFSQYGVKSLPKNIRKYLDFITNHTGVPIAFISYGPARDEIIDLRHL